jgi:hypothetical protein
VELTRFVTDQNFSQLSGAGFSNSVPPWSDSHLAKSSGERITGIRSCKGHSLSFADVTMIVQDLTPLAALHVFPLIPKAGEAQYLTIRCHNSPCLIVRLAKSTFV